MLEITSPFHRILGRGRLWDACVQVTTPAPVPTKTPNAGCFSSRLRARFACGLCLLGLGFRATAGQTMSEAFVRAEESTRPSVRRNGSAGASWREPDAAKG